MIVDRTLEALGGLDLLVNCAGLSLAGSFTEATPEQWDRVFAVNARAPFFICQAALPALRSSEKPMVINIASVVGFKGYANQSVYASSKHALTGFTKVFAKEDDDDEAAAPLQPLAVRILGGLGNMIMPLAVTIYLFIGCVRGLWHPSWIIFIIAAVLTAAVHGIAAAVGGRE